jgi:predicted ester cyclase
MDIKEFAEKFAKAEDDAFQKGDFAALSKLEDPNVIYHMGPLGDIVGHEAHKKDIMGTRQACSDLKQEWKYLTGEGNLFAMDYKASARFTGEKPGFPIPIGKKISNAYLFVIRLNNGKISEAWAGGNMTISD